jgi:zinc transport system substrate-binding protein
MYKSRGKLQIGRSLGWLFLGLFISVSASADNIRVLSSLKPLALLVAAVVDGTSAESEYLLTGAATPHHYALKPSDVKKVAGAQVLVWAGADMEPYLSKVVGRLKDHQAVIDFSSVASGPDKKAGHDPHYWLNPYYAGKFVSLLASSLGEIDKKNAAIYLDNAVNFNAKLNTSISLAAHKLQPVRMQGFVVLHDAYHHFVDAFQLKQLGSVSDSADHRHGVRNMGLLKDMLQSGEAGCLVAEQGSDSASTINALRGDANAVVVVVDPLARKFVISPEGYLLFFDDLVESFYRCLAGL